MKFRFTYKKLNGISNRKLLYCLIQERKSKLNTHCPLWKRLVKLQKEEKLTLEDTFN